MFDNFRMYDADPLHERGIMFFKRIGRADDLFNRCPYWIRVFLKTLLDKEIAYSDANDTYFNAYSEFILQFVDYKCVRNNAWQFCMKQSAREYFAANPQVFDDITDEEIRQHARRTDQRLYIAHFSTEFYWWYYSDDDYIEPKALADNPFFMRNARSIRPIDEDKPQCDDYCISDEMYDHVVDIIRSCCYGMENSARTFSSLGEEQLRDNILTTLGTHYNNSAGETFRRLGKTDICVQIENRAAYIAECKIWHGEKAFLEAIEQLFSYTTWRDTKVSIVIFNKDNKNFDLLLDTIQHIIEARAKQSTKTEHAQWRCVIQDEGRERDMLVTVQVFDLYI